MCGIAGRLGPRLEPGESQVRLEAAARRLEHRGPDGAGIVRRELGVFEMGLAHRRLSVIDLSEMATQPFQSDDAAIVLSYNGEIYNYVELRDELRALGARFRTESDTEVLLRGYEFWGEDVLSRLRGMFAFALWDERQRKLVLARDRIGIKPLYYQLTGDSVTFASEIQALAPLSRSGWSIDASAIDAYLLYLYVPTPRTIYREVASLEPGCVLTFHIREGRLVQNAKRYWTQPQRIVPRDVAAARSEVRAELETVMRQHMRADVPVGVFLSGGLDSTVITALLTQQGHRVKTFCMTFGDAEKLYDERHYAKAVAARYCTDHHEIEVHPELTELLPTVVRHLGQPFGNPTALLMADLSRQTRQHVTVALSGDGGDELFLGYPRYLGAKLLSYYRLAPTWARARLAHYASRWIHDSTRGEHRLRRMREFLESGTESVEGAYTRWVGYADSELRRELLPNPPAAGEAERWLKQLFAGSLGRKDATRAAFVDLQSFLPENVLTYGDRMSMLHGLEVRVPFCDHVLVESVMSIPESVRFPGYQLKQLLREAVADLLPSTIQRRPKMGFNPPVGIWLNGPARPLADQWLLDPRSRLWDYFNPDPVKRLIMEHRRGERDRSLMLWSLMVFGTWLETCAVGHSAGGRVTPLGPPSLSIAS